MTLSPANQNQNPYLPPRPAPPPRVNPWLIRLPVLFITGIILLLVVLLGLLAVFRLGYAGRVTPGVSAYGVDLGGMTRDEAVAALSQRFDYDQTAVFNLRDGESYWQLTAGELGVNFDAEATVDQALAISHDDGAVGDIIDQARVWFNGTAIAPIIQYDQNVAVERLTAIAAQINRQMLDATLTLNGTQVVTTPAQPGRALNIPATMAALDNALLNLTNGGDISLVIEERFPAVISTQATAAQLNAALSGPLELVADGPNGEQLGPWVASVDQIASLLRVDMIENPGGGAQYQASVDMGAFEDFLMTLAPGLIASPQNGRFHFDDTTRQLEVLEPAINGRELNIEETLFRLEQAVFRYDNRTVPMAFNYTLPTYHNNVTAAELGITELVAEATTYYTASTPNRRHNIAEGASRFDGLIIGPGEEFSFNYWLGDVSLEAGFLESKVIAGERTVDGIGGGICQVSTTVFRAAFTGGFTIIERNSHAYRVGFYELNGPPGLDAAIWTPDRDFRFQNDTPYHLLIETSVYPANETIQFRLYSTNPGRVVEIQEPTIRNIVPALAPGYEPNSDLQPGQAVQVDWAAEGADVNVVRIIRDENGNEIKRDNIFTHYLPWRAVYQVAPGDSRLNNS